MRSAVAGDGTAYHSVLKSVTPVLRAVVRRGLARAGQPVDQSEDIVQDILMAVDPKRHTRDIDAPSKRSLPPTAPIAPNPSGSC